MKNKEIEELIAELSPVYKKAKESVAKLPIRKQLHDWYIYAEPAKPDELPCDLCGQGKREHLVVEVCDWNFEELNWMDFMQISSAICSSCLGKIWLVQRDIWENRFFEYWDSEVGVYIVCLHCGKKDFVYASWNSWGGREVVEEWVARKEREHTNICEDC